MSLPPNLFYEESKDSFKKRVGQGKFWIDQEEKIAYLFIKGDGTFGKRLFILDKNLNLYIIHLSNDGEGERDYILYKYDRATKAATFIGSFEQALFDDSK